MSVYSDEGVYTRGKFSGKFCGDGFILLLFRSDKPFMSVEPVGTICAGPLSRVCGLNCRKLCYDRAVGPNFSCLSYPLPFLLFVRLLKDIKLFCEHFVDSVLFISNHSWVTVYNFCFSLQYILIVGLILILYDKHIVLWWRAGSHTGEH